MLKKLIIRSRQFVEVAGDKGFWPTLKSCIYEEKEAIPVVRDLATLKDFKGGTLGGEVELLEITMEKVKTQELRYPLKSRRQKAEANLNMGLSSFALVEKDLVLADVWYVVGPSTSKGPIHRDLRLFQIELGPEDVYMFDLYLDPDRRGKDTARSFIIAVQHALKGRGIRKVYGYFVKDNFPALWVHRSLGYDELPSFVLRRYGGFDTAGRK